MSEATRSILEPVAPRPRQSRRSIVEAIAERGGVISNKSGRCTSVLGNVCGFTGSQAGLNQLLRSMEMDGDITRNINGKRCYEIRLTDVAYKRYKLAGGPAPLFEPVTPPSTTPIALDIDKLAAAMRRLDGAELEETRQDLARAEAEVEKWRDQATANDQAATTYRLQLDEVTKALNEARAELKRMKEERRQVNDVAEMAAIANRTPGWSARQTDGNNHWQFLKDGVVVAGGASTPSDFRSAKNTRSYLRKAGLNV